MTSYLNRRLHTRNYYKAPIIYSNFNAERYCDATTYNNSIGGMYFESDYALRRGTNIYIKMINFSPERYVPGAYKAYTAEVRWCSKIKNTSVLVYGTGVCYTAKGHIVYRKRACQFDYGCDLCGNKVPLDQIHKTEESLYLCMDCFKYIGKLNNGKIKEGILKFIIGNVF